MFVDGCYWHGCPRCFRAPGENAGYWAEKIARNRNRDRSVRRSLRLKGWSVLSFWEHALRAEDAVARKIKRAKARSDEPQVGGKHRG